LDDPAARSAIEMPIDKYNQLYESENPIRIEARLVDEVLAQLKSEQVTLKRVGHGIVNSARARHIETPYLQLVMTRLWAQELAESSRTLHLETLKKLGGAETIVKRHLDLVMKRLSSDHQLLASKIFQYLVTPSGTKIALGASDLSSFVDIPAPVVKALLQRLSERDVRLLRAIETKDESDAIYEIFHDVLAAPILEWRERWQYRYKLRSRISLIGLAFVLVVVYISIIIFGMPTDVSAMLNNSCIGPLLCLAVLIGIIGFVTGVNWARTR